MDETILCIKHEIPEKSETTQLVKVYIGPFFE